MCTAVPSRCFVPGHYSQGCKDICFHLGYRNAGLSFVDGITCFRKANDDNLLA